MTNPPHTDKNSDLDDLDHRTLCTETEVGSVLIVDAIASPQQQLLLTPRQAAALHHLIYICDEENHILPQYKNNNNRQRTYYISPHEDTDQPLGGYIEFSERTENNKTELEIKKQDNTTITLSPNGVTALESKFKEWDKALIQDNCRYKVIALKYRRAIEGDNAIEPVLHKEHDEIVEFTYSFDGCWSPKKETYIWR